MLLSKVVLLSASFLVDVYADIHVAFQWLKFVLGSAKKSDGRSL